jgi:peptidoglycan/LPS O-acetylase OafA/YrhL
MMRRFAWFDSLRCVAILLVIAAHGGNPARIFSAPWAGIAAQLQALSWIGVELFFVLSGFLVSGLLFDEHDATGRLDIPRFLLRRAFKIVPPFYFLVLVTLIVDAVFRGKIVWVHLVHDLLFLQSYRAGAWPHAWTLAVEVHFYLLLALLLYYLARTQSRPGAWLARLPWILSGLIAAEFALRLLNSTLRHHFNYDREIEPTHLHLDVLAAGVLLRYVYQYRHRALAFLQRGRMPWAALGLLLVWPSALVWQPHPAWLTALVPTCNALGFSLVVFEATQFSYPERGWAHALAWPFDYLGKHSYSIYLWHLPVKEWLVDPLVQDRGLPYLLALYAGSLAVGTLFSVALEMPVLHLRNRLFPSARIKKTVPPDPGVAVGPVP